MYTVRTQRKGIGNMKYTKGKPGRTLTESYP